MLILNYHSKKQMKECIGKPLRYTETSMFGDECKPGATVTGSNRPTITGIRRPDGKKAGEFFASVTLDDDCCIVKVK